MPPSVFYVPDDLPEDIAARLVERFGIKPGDAILRFPGESPPYTLQRDFDGSAATELGTIIGRLIREQGPARRRRAPSDRRRRASGDRFPRLEK